MRPPFASAPMWHEQPAGLPHDVQRPAATPLARVRLREHALHLADLVGASDAPTVVHAADVEALVAAAMGSTAAPEPAPPAGSRSAGATSRAAAPAFGPRSLTSTMVGPRSTALAPVLNATSRRVPILRTTDGALRLARAAHAAARVLRGDFGQPVHVRFHAPSPTGSPRGVVVENIDLLTSEALAHRLRDTNNTQTHSRPAPAICLELVDVSQLGLESVQLSAGSVPVIGLCAPTRTVVPAATSAGSTSLTVVETVEVTVADTSSAPWTRQAALLKAVTGALDAEVHR